MSDLTSQIRQAQSGDIGPLVSALKGKSMSPTGFEKTSAGSFGDGYMEDREWLDVENAVMDGDLDEATYNKVKAAVYGTGDSDADNDAGADTDSDND